MPYSTCLQTVLASLFAGQFAREFRGRLEPSIEGLLACVVRFLSQPITPFSTATFEKELAQQSRELARQIADATYNHIEEAGAAAAPQQVCYEMSGYRRLAQATAHRHVATLFGTIVLWRHGYRPCERDSSEATIFPVEQALGLSEGVTPALAERTGRLLAEAGATQERVLEQLRTEHGVTMGVKRLRALASALADGMNAHRQQAQVRRLLALLAQAQASRGRHKPVLSVGRDGITLGEQPHGFFEVASTATVTVYDRRGQRLGTVYLAYVPEYGQGTLSTQLTNLVEEVLRQWPGPVPRLCYVTDAGDNETSYYQQVLRRMRHPVSGEKLTWQWIVDYYHAAERITTLAEALFRASTEGQAWSRKMRKLLLKPGGVARVLYSAAALRSRRGVAKKRLADYRRAYNYLRERTAHMHYAEFRHLGLPIGSGVTEAACKTVFTQRLKLSGMRWKKAGAQVILDLRIILLSGIWEEVYTEMLKSKTKDQARTWDNCHRQAVNKAA
jgi:hypothetical protein